jgi:aerobic-type carbon monoxide dehydrogenase small subunit (CoxS/CutS family)
MKSLSLNVNGNSIAVQVQPDEPLLWVLREQAGLTGTKFGCGIAACGACTVLIDGRPVRSCSLPATAVGTRAIVTIEGLSRDRSHPVQRAWIEHQVPQCGYCQSGMVLAAAALLAAKPNPSDADIDASMINICRCGTYPRVRAAIHAAARRAPSGATTSPKARSKAPDGAAA